MRSKAFVLVLLLVAQAFRPASVTADVIDRILAIVSGGLILHSDVRAAIGLGLVEVPSEGDRTQVVLDRLIERRLMLLEVDRYGPPEPHPKEIISALSEIDKRVGSGERMDAIMRDSGFTVEQLRIFVRDDLRIAAYLQQRFGAATTAADDEIVQYYRAHERDFTRGGVLRPFEEVRDQALRALLAERRSLLIREWLASLRRRAEVSVLYLPVR